MQAVLEDAVIGATFCFIIWVIFTNVRRYGVAKAKANLQEKVLQRIDSSDALAALAANESGRRFLESLTVEPSQSASPTNRILFGVQAGIVLFFFGIATLILHHHTPDPGAGFMITGIGAIGLGLGFLTASAASLVVSRKLGLIPLDARDNHAPRV